VSASQVVLKRIEGGSVGTVTVQAAGWIEAEPYKSYVTALTDGIVNRVFVLEGDDVKSGQVVARLVDQDAELSAQASDAQVREMEALLEIAKAELVSAKTEWENPVERMKAISVSEAQLGESRATLEQIASEIVAEESDLEFLKSEYERGVGLHAANVIAELELVRRRSRFHAQRAKIEATRQRYIATKELIAKHQAELHANRELMRLRTEERRKLDRAQASVTQAEAALQRSRTGLAEARLRLERTQIRSPIDGTVMARLTEPGSKVVVMSDNPASARILSLYDREKLQVRVDVPLADAGKIGVGQRAEVSLDVLPERVFSGVVTRVLHEANIQKNTLEIKVGLQNPDPQLRPEMLSRVRFLAKTDAAGTENQEIDRLFVPENACKTSGTGTIAWVITDFDGTYGHAVPRPVKLGHLKKEGWVDAVEGLSPGDLVVNRTSAELKAGQRVKITKD
jgi:RND family efflux transporter MFP subunit